MKLIVKAISIMLAVLALASCKEDKAPASVEGTVDWPGNSAKFNGSLSKGAADNFGTCSFNGSDFSFEVGHSSIGNLTGDEIWISGSASDVKLENGVEEDGDPKNDESLYQKFDKVNLRTPTNYFIEYQDQSENCAMELYAQPVGDERMPDSKASYDFYVRIQCTSLDNVGTDENPLSSIELEFYFANC